MAKASTKTSVKNSLKELDRISNVGTSKVLKMNKDREIIREELSEDGMTQKVMDFIFDGDPESVSPLQEIRDRLE